MLNWSTAELDFVIKNAPFVADDEGCRQFCMIFDKTISVNTWRKLRTLVGLKRGRAGSGTVTIIPGSPLDQAGVTIENLTKVKI